MSKTYTEKQIKKAKEVLLESGYFGNLNFHLDDIKGKIEDYQEFNPEYEGIEITEEEIQEIADKCEKSISNNEGIYEYYWFTIEDFIGDLFRDKAI